MIKFKIKKKLIYILNVLGIGVLTLPIAMSNAGLMGGIIGKSILFVEF